MRLVRRCGFGVAVVFASLIACGCSGESGSRFPLCPDSTEVPNAVVSDSYMILEKNGERCLATSARMYVGSEGYLTVDPEYRVIGFCDSDGNGVADQTDGEGAMRLAEPENGGYVVNPRPFSSEPVAGENAGDASVAYFGLAEQPVTDEWTIVCIDEGAKLFRLVGLKSGSIGTFSLGSYYSDNRVGTIRLVEGAVGARLGDSFSFATVAEGGAWSGEITVDEYGAVWTDFYFGLADPLGMSKRWMLGRIALTQVFALPAMVEPGFGFSPFAVWDGGASMDPPVAGVTSILGGGFFQTVKMAGDGTAEHAVTRRGDLRLEGTKLMLGGGRQIYGWVDSDASGTIDPASDEVFGIDLGDGSGAITNNTWETHPSEMHAVRAHLVELRGDGVILCSFHSDQRGDFTEEMARIPVTIAPVPEKLRAIEEWYYLQTPESGHLSLRLAHPVFDGFTPTVLYEAQ